MLERSHVTWAIAVLFGVFLNPQAAASDQPSAPSGWGIAALASGRALASTTVAGFVPTAALPVLQGTQGVCVHSDGTTLSVWTIPGRANDRRCRISSDDARHSDHARMRADNRLDLDLAHAPWGGNSASCQTIADDTFAVMIAQPPAAIELCLAQSTNPAQSFGTTDAVE